MALVCTHRIGSEIPSARINVQYDTSKRTVIQFALNSGKEKSLPVRST